MLIYIRPEEIPAVQSQEGIPLPADLIKRIMPLQGDLLPVLETTDAVDYHYLNADADKTSTVTCSRLPLHQRITVPVDHQSFKKDEEFLTNDAVYIDESKPQIDAVVLYDYDVGQYLDIGRTRDSYNGKPDQRDKRLFTADGDGDPERHDSVGFDFSRHGTAPARELMDEPVVEPVALPKDWERRESRGSTRDSEPGSSLLSADISDTTHGSSPLPLQLQQRQLRRRPVPLEDGSLRRSWQLTGRSTTFASRSWDAAPRNHLSKSDSRRRNTYFAVFSNSVFY